MGQAVSSPRKCFNDSLGNFTPVVGICKTGVEDSGVLVLLLEELELLLPLLALRGGEDLGGCCGGGDPLVAAVLVIDVTFLMAPSNSINCSRILSMNRSACSISFSNSSSGVSSLISSSSSHSFTPSS